MSSFTPVSPKPYTDTSSNDSLVFQDTSLRQTWRVLLASVFLVSVPVFIQAPLVRWMPALSLVVTGGWLLASVMLCRRSNTLLWGDLLIGFSWTWLAGSIYWGWLRWEPLLHLPVEAIGLPLALICLSRGWAKVGSWFYLGSLLGTIITDVYFYIVDLIPQWRQLMTVNPDMVQPIFQSAILRMQTPWGMNWAIVLVTLLLLLGLIPLQSKQLHWWAFGGAVLSTLLVDGLFWLAATLA